MSMEKGLFKAATGNRNNRVEAAILSANRKYFEGNQKMGEALSGAESNLYNSVIRYFAVSHLKQ